MPINASRARAGDEASDRAEQAAQRILAGGERIGAEHRERTQHDPEGVLRPGQRRDQDGEAEAGTAAQAVVQPHRVALEVRSRALLRRRQRPREPRRRAAAEQPLEPAPALGRRDGLDVRADLRDDEAQLLRAKRRVERADAALQRGRLRERAALHLDQRVAQRVQGLAQRAGTRRPGSRAASAPRSSALAAASFTAQTGAVDGALAPLGGRDEHDRASQPISSTRRTSARVAVLSPVGRYGVAKNTRCERARPPLVRAANAASSSCCGTGGSPSDVRDVRAQPLGEARHAAIAGARSVSRLGLGHSSATARSAAPDAMPHPASRSGTVENAPGSETGRMNASSSALVAPASTELTTPAKSTPNATPR